MHFRSLQTLERTLKEGGVVDAGGLRSEASHGENRYTIERSGREHAFWLTVFVTDQEVITIEAGGDVAFFGGVEKSVTQAIATLRVG